MILVSVVLALESVYAEEVTGGGHDAELFQYVVILKGRTLHRRKRGRRI